MLLFLMFDQESGKAVFHIYLLYSFFIILLTLLNTARIMQ